jgi:hypothetical protein
LLDLYRGYGYEMVIPPLMEHLESLLTGSGHDLGLTTLKLVDQLSGRTLGLRADTTPQVARIDSHILNREGVARLCYAGSTLHARPMHPLASREPLQIGAEIYGDADFGADREILELAVRSARTIGIARVQVDLGHTGVVRALLGDLLHAPAGVEQVLAALTGKDPAALQAASAGLSPQPAGLARAAGFERRLGGARAGAPRTAALRRPWMRRWTNWPVGAGLRRRRGEHRFVRPAWVSVPHRGHFCGLRRRTVGTAVARRALRRHRPGLWSGATGDRFFLLDLREAAQLVRADSVRAILAPRRPIRRCRRPSRHCARDGEVVICHVGRPGRRDRRGTDGRSGTDLARRALERARTGTRRMKIEHRIYRD